MQCIAPIILKGSNKSHGFASEKVPCGRCPACLQRRAQQWIFRLLQEQKVSDSALFLTLTYDEANVPYVPMTDLMNLRIKDHQDFIKRLRKSSTCNKAIKYYACGEYGTLSERPHFHSILFNLLGNEKRPEHIANSWQNGEVHALPVTSARIAYVTQYLDKRIERPDGDPRTPEKSLMSKGLGLSYIKPATKAYYKKKLLPYLHIEGNQKISMPRYYRNKIYTEDEQIIVNSNAKKFIEKSEPKTSEDFKKQVDQSIDSIRLRDKKNTINRSKI